MGNFTVFKNRIYRGNTILSLLCTTILFLSFQNCSGSFSTSTVEAASAENASTSDDGTQSVKPVCSIGEAQTGYLMSSVLYPLTCGQAITKTCIRGQWSRSEVLSATCKQQCVHPEALQAVDSGTVYSTFSTASGSTQAACDSARVTSTCNEVTGTFLPAPAINKTCLVVGQTCAYTTGAGISNPNGNSQGSSVTGYKTSTSTYPSLCANPVTSICSANGTWTNGAPLYSACTQKCLHPDTNQPVDQNSKYIYYSLQSGSQAQCDAAKVTSTCQSASGLFSPAPPTNRFSACNVVVAPVISSLTANPATITSGDSSTLNWTVSGATSLSLSSGIGVVTGTSKMVTPAVTTTYTLTAMNAAGSVTSSVTVTVTTATEPNNPIGSTYYISPTGSDSNAGISAAPWKTFSKAWATLKAGDLLILKDGTYKQDMSPPAGKAGTESAPITVRADHDGLAIIDGEGTRPSLNLAGTSYLVFEGMNVGNGISGSVSIGSSTGKSSGVSGHHNTLRRMGIFGWKGLSGNNVTVGIGGGAHHNLIEDVWIWGNGRYSLMIYGGAGGGDILDAPYNVVRRVVIRHDPFVSGSGDPQAGLAVYSANNNIVENVIVLDSIQQSDSDNSVFYLTGHAPDTVNNNKILGSIALNSEGGGLVMDADISSSNVFENLIIWKNQGGISLTKDAKGNTYNKITMNNSGSPAFYHAGASTILQNSLVMNSTSYGVKNSGSLTATYNYFFGNNSTDCEGCSLNATNDVTHRDPKISYILRRESDSPLKGTASDGSDRGATVMYQYKNGVLTNQPLWPWPNEARIRQDFCSSISLTNYGRSGNRVSALCAGGKSLTNYVWEFAGVAMPSSLYP